MENLFQPGAKSENISEKTTLSPIHINSELVPKM